MTSLDAAELPLGARLDARRRPSGCALLHQRWHGLVFLHWAFPPGRLASLVPAGLNLDLFEGRAWVGITPFRVSHMRPTLFPPLPGLSEASEINVRMYVHRDGIPGIWFPSLDITNRLAMWAARIAYRLPYFHARMHVAQKDVLLSFTSERSDGTRPALFNLQWRRGEPLEPATAGTLEFFLTERYVLYSGDAAHLKRARIHHRPWPLRGAEVVHLASTLLEANGIPVPDSPVLAHAQGEPFEVEVWPPSDV
jgi:uncharacterized protein YqjF (DUF2071 family)